MAKDYTEKVAKEAVALLPEGEHVTRAVVANPSGGVMDTFGTGEIRAGRVARKARQASREVASQGGIAASIPHKNAYLAVTDKRFVIFDLTKMGKLKSVVGAFEPAELPRLQATRRDRTTQELTLTFADDTAITYAVIQKQDADAMVSAFEALR